MAKRDPQCCKECGTSNTPLWRYGPEGSKTLCNACGIRWKRANKAKVSGAPKRPRPPGEKKLKKPPRLFGSPSVGNEIVSCSPEERLQLFDHFVETVEDEYEELTESEAVPYTDDEAAEPMEPQHSSVFPHENDAGAAEQRAASELWLQFLASQQHLKA